MREEMEQIEEKIEEKIEGEIPDNPNIDETRRIYDILQNAANAGASYIHFESHWDRGVCRFRINERYWDKTASKFKIRRKQMEKDDEIAFGSEEVEMIMRRLYEYGTGVPGSDYDRGQWGEGGITRAVMQLPDKVESLRLQYAPLAGGVAYLVVSLEYFDKSNNGTPDETFG